MLSEREGEVEEEEEPLLYLYKSSLHGGEIDNHFHFRSKLEEWQIESSNASLQIYLSQVQCHPLVWARASENRQFNRGCELH